MTWSVDYAPALERWIRDHTPTDARIDMVVVWLVMVEVEGPPDNSFHVYNDFYTAQIRGALVRANFLAIMQDRKVIVKEFR